MTFVDLAPAAGRMAELVTATPDTALDAPTPCAAYTVGDLLDHINMLTVAFTAAATKTGGGALASRPPLGDRTRLEQDWRRRMPRYLSALTESWRDPAARTGMTRAGGIDMPGEVAAVVALEELVVHGWDLARALGVNFECDPSELEAVRGFIDQFPLESRGDAFDAPVTVNDRAALLDRVIALSGRDPAWRPPG